MKKFSVRKKLKKVTLKEKLISLKAHLLSRRVKVYKKCYHKVESFVRILNFNMKEVFTIVFPMDQSVISTDYTA